MAEIWPFVPQREFTETLEWVTDVISCRGSEQRIGVRPLPRLGLSYDALLDHQQASFARTLARTASLGEFIVPMWGEATRLGPLAQGLTSLALDTTWAQYAAGRQAIIFDEFDRVEVVQVGSVEPDRLTLSAETVKSMVNAYVMPCCTMRPAQEFEFMRASAEDLQRVKASFYATDVMDVSGSMGATSYRSHPVLTVPPMATGSLGERVLHESDTVDNGTGPVSVFRQLNYVTSKVYMAWDCLTVQELWELRRWLYAAAGRRVGFWRPTWGHDLQLLNTVAPADLTMTVAAVGFTGRMTDRDVAVMLTSGDVLYRRVTHAEAGLAGTEVLHLETSLGASVAPAAVDRISFLNFARLDADRVEIRHRVARGSSVQVPITEVPQP